jgi:hypothetical protein
MSDMDVISDFEDMLIVFDKHEVRYLVIGGLAFIYHVKPRYTKDMDLWVEPTEENIRRANAALVEFGSPHLLDPADATQMLQIGVAPARVDIILTGAGADFGTAWNRRVRSMYGKAPVNWIDLDGLIAMKEKIDDPRHKSDVRYLLKVREMRRTGKRARAGRE